MDDKHRLTTDEEGYVYCRTYIPKIAGMYSGACAIIGGGKQMWNEFEQLKALETEVDIICVNVAGMFIPKAKHLFSWHAKQISAIKAFRKAEMPDDESLVHSVREHPGIDYVWYLTGCASTSGLSAVDFAWLLGYRKYILVGVPMDNTGYFYKPSVNHEFYDIHRQKEVRDKSRQYGDSVKSFSGYTQEIFGTPTREWLIGETNVLL
jgi:hypothetical protein